MTTPITTCEAFELGLNAVLDGAAPRTLLTDAPHYPACGDCRELYAAAVLLQGCDFPLPTPANTFAEGVLHAVRLSEVADRRRRRAVTASALIALAAAVLLTVSLVPPTPPRPESPPVAMRPAAKSPTVTQSVAEAKQAVATLSEKVLDETVTPARNLFASHMETQATPSAEPLAELPDAAKAGLEPISATTRRAFGTLLRDVNSFAGVVKKDS